MEHDFISLMAKKTDDELITILKARHDEYSEAALAAAKDEFDKRNIPSEKIEKIAGEQTVIKQADLARENEPLEKNVKMLAIFLPLVARISYAQAYRTGGYERKYAELFNAVFIGRMIYIGFFLLLFTIIQMSKTG